MPCHQGRAPRAFTVIELLIVVMILGILAMLVVPTFVTTDEPARGGALRECLRFMRTQIELYAGQHDGLAPGYPGGDRLAVPTEAAFVEQLTSYSDKYGTTSPGFSPATPIKPYLREIPANPFNGLESVRVLGDAETFPAPTGETWGWFYHPATRTFKANTADADDAGRSYSDY